MALGEAVRRGRERHPDKEALIVGERRWSYAEFDAITDRLAASLLRLGVRPGDRVALLFPNGAEIVFGYYACFKIGAAAVPLNVRLKGPEIEYVLNHCAARLFLGQADLFPEVDSVRPGLRSVEGFYLAGDAAAFPGVRPFAELLDPPGPEGRRQKAEGSPGGPDAESSADAPSPLPSAFCLLPSDPAVILYTSGTTARPKGVTHTHQTLERTVANYLQYSELQSDDVFGIFASGCHIAGFATQLLPAVSLGATLLLFPSFDPELVLRSFQEHRVTQCFGLPVMYNALVNCPGAASYDVRSLRFCLAGGDAVPTELQRRFQATFGVEITEACGMTEVIPYCGNPPYGTKKTGSIGPPTPGVQIRLVDATGQDVPPGEAGEILVRSEGNMVGYWENPEVTAATLQEGWLHTGDLGRVDEDGYYWFVGRAKEIIIRGGSNISPLEVEEILYQHPAVREAAVVGVPDASWGEIVQAYVALKEGEATSEADLLQFLKERIAAYKVPERITFLPDLPKGLTGKVHRKTLKDWAIAAAE